MEIAGHRVSGAPVCAYGEWQDLSKCWFREPWDTQEEKGEAAVPRLSRSRELLPALPASSVEGKMGEALMQIMRRTKQGHHCYSCLGCCHIFT